MQRTVSNWNLALLNGGDAGPCGGPGFGEAGGAAIVGGVGVKGGNNERPGGNGGGAGLVVVRASLPSGIGLEVDPVLTRAD